MPIEIKELHIKTVVNNENKKDRSPAGQPQAMKAIVAQCVEQVMEIINQKGER